MNKIEKVYFGFLILIVSLPIAAPVLSSLGLNDLSKYIYFLYSFFCHQFDTRSIHFHDYQYAWCARDTGIWLGILVGAIAYYKNYLPKIRWYHLLFFTIPIAFDGGIQTISTFGQINPSGSIEGDIFYVSNNFARFLTGSLFGLGVGLWVTQFFSEKGIQGTLKMATDFKKLLTLILVLLVVYIVSIIIWGISSRQYPPTNILDSEPKLQRENFFQRRAHGECPNESALDLINADCFF